MAPTRQKNATPPQVLANGHDTTEEREDDTTVIEVDGVETGADTTVTEPEVDPGVAALQAQLEAANRKNADLEAERDRLRGERQADAKVLTDSRLLVIESTIKTKEAAKDAVKQRLREAKEAGDTNAEIEATDELQIINNDLRAATLGKDRLEQQIEESKNAPSDQLEAWFEHNKIGEQSRDWLRSHRDYLEDPVKNAELTLAHRRAEAAGHKANSPGYFEHIETGLGMRDEPETQEPATEERRISAPSAPVSRGGGAGGGGVQATSYPGILQTGPGKYRIENSERGRLVKEAIEMSGLPTAEWIKEALLLKRESDGQLH